MTAVAQEMLDTADMLEQLGPFELYRESSSGQRSAPVWLTEQQRDLAVTALRESAAPTAMLQKVLRWFEQSNDGEEGSHYINGDSDKYPGDGQADAESLEVELREFLARQAAAGEALSFVTLIEMFKAAGFDDSKPHIECFRDFSFIRFFEAYRAALTPAVAPDAGAGEDGWAFAKKLSNALLKIRPLGGSELFVKRNDDYYADPEFCGKAIEELHRKYHAAMKEAVLTDRALAQAQEPGEADLCQCPKCGRMHRGLRAGRPPAIISGEST